MIECNMSSDSDFSDDDDYEYNSEEESKTYTVKEAYGHVLEILSHKEEFSGDALKTILQADKDLYDELEVSSKLAELRPKIRMLVYQINALRDTINKLKEIDIREALDLLKDHKEQQELLQNLLKESHHYTYEQVQESKQALAKGEIIDSLSKRAESLREQRQQASIMLGVLEQFEKNEEIFFSTYTKQQEQAAIRARAAEARAKKRAREVMSHLKKPPPASKREPDPRAGEGAAAVVNSKSKRKRDPRAAARAKAAEARAKKRARRVMPHLTGSKNQRTQKKNQRTQDAKSEARAKQLEEMLGRKK